MALTITPVRTRDSHGNQQRSITDVTLDGSYVAGGVALTALQLGLTFVQDGTANIVTAAATGNAVDAIVVPQVDGSAKLKLAAAAAEVANAAGTGLVVRVTAFGY